MTPTRGQDGSAREAYDVLVVELTDEEVSSLSASAKERRHPSGSPLFFEGDASDEALVVVHGHVKVTGVAEDGREVLLAVRGPGDILGEMSLLDGKPRSATARAVDDVRAVHLSRTEFEGFLERHPRLAVTLLQTLAGRLRDADVKRLEYAGLTTEQRLARRILELADSYGLDTPDGTLIDVPLSQEEIAGWVGATRESVARALRTLRDSGCVLTRRRRLVIVDRDTLEGFT